MVCPRCLIETMVRAGELSPAARDMEPEDALDQHANALAIDRTDESSYDSDEFPKVVFYSPNLEGDTCGYCAGPLI
jgi:hypothetical protein